MKDVGMSSLAIVVSFLFPWQGHEKGKAARKYSLTIHSHYFNLPSVHFACRDHILPRRTPRYRLHSVGLP